MSEDQELMQAGPEELPAKPAVSGDGDASAEDPAQAAMIKRYGFTPQQAEILDLYL
jgi:hypothetical protein